MTEINTGFEKEELAVDPATFPVDRYKPIRLLGQGALGYVYLCKDRNLGKKVAVKCLLSITDDKVMMFHKEARIASRLNHESVIHVLDFGISNGGNPFMVMEYFDGCSLESLMASRGPLDEEVAIKLFVTVCDALSYMHNNGIFHRDLKPSNILVAERDNNNFEVRLIDFNLSKTTVDVQFKTIVAGRTVVGTPAYMSPDQISGHSEYDEISEVYSVGCVMYEALTGVLPFTGETSLEILNHHMYSELISPLAYRPNLSNDINDVLERCLSKGREQRYQSIDELRDQLKSIIAPPVASDYDDSSKYGARHVSSPRQRLAIITLFGLILVFGALALWAAAPYVLPEKEQNTRHTQLTSFRRLSDVGVRVLEHVSDTKALLLRKIKSKDTTIRLAYNSTDDDVKILLTYKALNSVDLSDCAVTEESLAYLTQLPNLTTLILDGTSLTRLNGIEKLTNLRVLSLRKLHLEDTALDHVAKLKNLRQLWLDRTKISDVGLSKLLPCSSLNGIELVDTGLTDKGLLQLKALKNLRYIQVRKTDITRNTARELISAFSLETLILFDCPKISMDDVVALENEFPATQLLVDRQPKILVMRKQAKDLVVLNHYRDARSLLESAVKIVKEKYGSNSPILVPLYVDIAHCSQALREQTRSDKELRTALEIADSNSRYVLAISVVTEMLESPNLTWKKKEPILLKRAALVEKEYGTSSMQYCEAVLPLGFGLAHDGQTARALPWIDLAVAAARVCVGPNSKECIATLVAKGDCLVRLKGFSEAESIYLETISLIKQSDERMAPHMVQLEIRARLGVAHVKRLQPTKLQDALKWNDQALKLARANQVSKEVWESVFRQRIAILTAMKNEPEAEKARQEFKSLGKY